MKRKFSSFHDDFGMPIVYRDEHDVDMVIPAVLPYDRKVKVHYINRITQLGVTTEEINKVLGKRPHTTMTEREFSQLVIPAIKRSYHTCFASIYGYWERMRSAQEKLLFVKRIADLYHSWGMNVVRNRKHLQGDSNLVLQLEGGECITGVSDVTQLVSWGIRCVNPIYNKDNQLGSEKDGLSDLGTAVIKKLLAHDVIVDLAHAPPRVRKDIFRIARDTGTGSHLAYTHGSIVEDMAKDHKIGHRAPLRGITLMEVNELFKLGGALGLGVSRPFFQTISQLAERIDSLLQFGGAEKHIGIGSDFGGVPRTWEIGIGKPEDFNKLGSMLSHRFKYDDDVINGIICDNVPRWLATHAGTPR